MIESDCEVRGGCFDFVCVSIMCVGWSPVCLTLLIIAKSHLLPLIFSSTCELLSIVLTVIGVIDSSK